MPETKVYKVQVPIDTNIEDEDDLPNVMAYTEREKGKFSVSVSDLKYLRDGKHPHFFWYKNIPNLKKWMKGKPKAYFNAYVEGELKNRKLIIISEAAWQNW